MKVLFINPHEIYHKDHDYFRIGNNLGIAFLAAVTRESGHEVEFLDCAAEGLSEQEEIDNGLYMVGLSPKSVVKRINSYAPDLICISCQRTPQHYSLQRIVKLIKTVDKKIPIAVGGANVTGLYEQILDQVDVDFVIRGEGEYPMLSLLRHLEGSLKKEKIPGLAFKDNDQIKINSISHVSNLDQLPDPEYGIFLKDLYANSRFHTACVRGQYLIDFVFSRGCPHNCTFCMASKINGVKNRSFPIDRIESQLCRIKELGYDEILLEDDDVLIDYDISSKVFHKLNELGFHWSILNGISPINLSSEIVETIAGLSCNRVYFPVESINFSVIENHKSFWKSSISKLNRTPQFIRQFIESGVEVFGGFMIGFPGETKEQILKTVDYAKFLREECGMSVALFFVVTPYPGTQLYNEAMKLGRIYKPQNWELYTFERSNMHNGVLSVDEINELRKYAMLTANGQVLYNEIFANNHRPDIRSFYRNNPDYKWSKYFINN